MYGLISINAKIPGVRKTCLKKSIQYIQILESLFIIFKVTPYSRNIARSVLKTPKIYFYDTGMVKRSEAQPARALINSSKRYGTPATQLVLHLKREKMDSGVRVCQGGPL